MESEASLLSELIFEILSRTSLETLEQCKSVSKDWKQIIYEPTFLPLHSQRTNSLFGYFFQTLNSSKYRSAFVSTAAGAIESTWPRNDDIEILASCDQGILICEREICRNKRFYACKPATSQWQALPNPKLRYQTKAVAVVVVRSQPLRYVVVRLYALGSQLHCEIFDSESWRWEKIDSAPPYGEIVINHSPSVTTAGRFVHWLTLEDNVLTLDAQKRRFRCSSLPGCLPKCRWTWPTLVEYEGELGFMCDVEEKDGSELEVWSNGKKKAVVNMREMALHHHHPVAVEFCSSNVVFIRSLEGGGFYNMQNRSFSKVEVPNDLRIPSQVFRFRSDTEIVDLKAGRYASQHKNIVGLSPH